MGGVLVNLHGVGVTTVLGGPGFLELTDSFAVLEVAFRGAQLKLSQIENELEYLLAEKSLILAIAGRACGLI